MLDCRSRLKNTVFPEKRRKSVDMRKANSPLSYFSFRRIIREKRRKMPAIDSYFYEIGEKMAVSYLLLLQLYPETIALEQLYRICRISKRKAKWLLENGYIPYEDTGKKTHRYKIKMKDVVDFLGKRDTHYSGYQLPVGVFSSRGDGSVNPIAEIHPDDFGRFLTRSWSHVPDALTVKEIATLLGYSPETVSNWIWVGRLKAVCTPHGRFVAMEWLIEFIACYTVENPNRLSQKHEMIAEAYIEQSSN